MPPLKTTPQWSITAWAPKLEPLPGELPADMAVRANTTARELWRALQDMSKAFNRAASKVGGGRLS